jgi:hypothetical protein
MRVLLFVVYLVIGVVVAASHHYFVHLGSVKPIASRSNTRKRESVLQAASVAA